MAGVRSGSETLQSLLRCNQHAPSAGSGGNLFLGGRSRRRRPSVPDHPRLFSCGAQPSYHQWLSRPICAQTSTAGSRLARYSARARQDLNAGLSAAYHACHPSSNQGRLVAPLSRLRLRYVMGRRLHRILWLPPPRSPRRLGGQTLVGSPEDQVVKDGSACCWRGCLPRSYRRRPLPSRCTSGLRGASRRGRRPSLPLCGRPPALSRAVGRTPPPCSQRRRPPGSLVWRSQFAHWRRYDGCGAWRWRRAHPGVGPLEKQLLYAVHPSCGRCLRFAQRYTLFVVG